MGTEEFSSIPVRHHPEKNGAFVAGLLDLGEGLVERSFAHWHAYPAGKRTQLQKPQLAAVVDNLNFKGAVDNQCLQLSQQVGDASDRTGKAA